MTVGVVLDASALVEYARNDLRSLPVDELLGEIADTGSPIIIGWFALDEARQILDDQPAALDHLEALVAEHGVRLPDNAMTKTVDLVSAEGQLSRGLAHSMLLAVGGRQLATYAAATLRAVGYDMGRVLDLDEIFRG